jgi:hypothetical protein
MKIGNQDHRIRFQQWVRPGKEQTVEELLKKLSEEGVTILAVEGDRILITDEES